MDATRKTDAVKAKQGLDTLFEISQILGTGLDKETLSVLVALCETGVNPEALASVVREVRREAAALQRVEGAAAGPGAVPARK